VGEGSMVWLLGHTQRKVVEDEGDWRLDVCKGGREFVLKKLLVMGRIREKIWYCCGDGKEG
jgi:hypothetical protein